MSGSSDRRAAATSGWIAFLFALAVAWTAGPAFAAADPQALANRQFIEAMQRIQAADTTFDSKEESRLLREAEQLLDAIVRDYPESPVAVQLITNQFIGDFDVFEFKNRVRALICNEPQATACFLYRIEMLLPPLEQPVTTPRWDWLSLAVAYHHAGSPDKAKGIIAPFLGALRRGKVTDGAEQDLFVARALALTGQMDLALQITRSINDCSTRIYNLADIAEIAAWNGDPGLAGALAEEAKSHAAAKGCSWELGLVVQALLHAGREAEARTLFLNTVEQQFSRFRETRQDCCPAELAVAAADLNEVNLALGLLRAVQEDSPWTVPAVLGRLAGNGETALATAYLDQLQDPDQHAEVLAEFVAAALDRGDAAGAAENMARLQELARDPANRRPAVLVQLARAERRLHGDDRWRSTFLSAVNAAERSSAYVRRDIGAPLLAALVGIETGKPLLD
ncbi:hypothetical protein [Arenibaculum sp.]|jgi:hypothetical protein|uniref:hypothetical protein n=1 Tax=Arenibaculum sp. TaxID=2865862 RepID=UPI002E105FD7|nr:hypothetical protein [Arenibaculum sp.]